MIDDTLKNDENIKNPESDIIDVDLGFIEKKKFRFGKDDNRILELNVADLNIAQRFKVGYPQLITLFNDAQKNIENIPDDLDNMELLNTIADNLTHIDNEMRRITDYIFDANVSEVCAPSGNMFDLIDGEYRFERIIDKLAALYSTNFDAEIEAMKKRISRKTEKYTGHK